MTDAPPKPPGIPRRSKILLVDDEPSVVRVLRRRLETQGYEVAVAMDGMQGLADAREGQPDLVILDLMLPRLNGYEVCRMLKKDPRYERLPILILTARAGSQDRQEGLDCGADAYLTKPFQPEVFAAEVQRLLGKSAA